MNYKLLIKSSILFLFFQSCYSQNQPVDNKTPVWEPETLNNNYNKAYFASGCFWCVEAIYESLRGVKEVYSGYAGGKTKYPTYRQIGTGLTNHSEAVEIIYDSGIINFKTLVEVFFGSHDPTTLNRQGPDYGSQYRSIAFYSSEKEKNIIKNYIVKLNKKNTYKNKIVTELKPLKVFYYAEKYHQDYERKNPNNPYVKAVSIPRLKRFKKKYPHLLKN
ncbi:MAG: peptide-methionine (S)-S-oxide reductase MsrA [Flavobacteriaceae bacterium]